MSKLIANYVKRIETILDSTRPNIPPLGTNHYNDPEFWNEDSIYVGELAIDLDNGDVYSRDEVQPVKLGKDDGVLEGLTIKTSGVSLREISVESGIVRIKGREYKYNSATDTDDSIIYIDENIEKYPRVDLIAVRGDLSVKDSDNYYGVEFKVFKGLSRANIPLPSVTSGYILLGAVLVKPNQTVNDILRPLSINFLYDSSNNPINVTPGKFKSDLTQRKIHWQPNTLYFEEQLLEFDNNLYKAAITHVSDENLENDFNNDYLVSMGAVTNSNVSRFSHIGSTPTTGDFSTLFFNEWNANTRILDAFQDISEFIQSFAPENPGTLEDVELNILSTYAKGGFANLSYNSTANIANVVVSDLNIVEAEVDGRFIPYDSGGLKSYLFTPNTSYSTETHLLSEVPSVLPNVTVLTDVSNKYEFTIEKDDHYGSLQGFKGFYKSISANIETLSNLSASNSAYTFRVTHLTSNDQAEKEFYVESERTPSIANVGNVKAISNQVTLKYMSGVPILVDADDIQFDFEVSDSVRYFYNHDTLATITGENIDGPKTINFSNSAYFETSSKPPFALLANSNVDGPVIYYSNVDTQILANTVSTTQYYEIQAFNSVGNSSTSTMNTAFVIDNIYDEVGVRVYSGDDIYATGPWGSTWAYIYNNFTSSANIMSNMELQYLGGRYFYPKENYSNIGGIYHDGDYIEYPNYKNDSDDYRYAMFDMGYMTAEKFFRFKIRESNGIEYDLSNGTTVSPNLQVLVRVWNPYNPEFSTGWIDGNEAYNSSLIENPAYDGQAALDLGYMEGNPNYRRVTFGTENRQGNVYVKIGTNSKTISFKDVIAVTLDPESSDGFWDVFSLGSIVGESYVIIEIEGTYNTLNSTFLNGTTMSSNFDIELKVRNEENHLLGTDWLDANESYPANSFIPVNTGDPSLDLSYYENGAPNSTIRKITFGPTTRTGEVLVRVRSTGATVYSNVKLNYPTIC